MTADSPSRGRVIEPDRWRTPADGPRWLYAEPGRLRVPFRLAVFGLAIMVIQPVAESIMAPMFGALSNRVGETVPAYPWITLVAIFASMALALRTVDRAPWSAVALGDGAFRARPLVAGAGLGTAAMVLTVALLLATGTAHFERVNDASGAEAWLATTLRLTALLAPAALWEELIFRGYLWTVAEQAAGIRVARWSTAVAFGVVHVLNPGVGVLSTILVILAGFCLGAVRESTGSLGAAWLAHLAWNWTMAALLHVPVSGQPFDTPTYRTAVDGPAWWTGGSWGPEGGAAAMLVMCGALLFWHRTERTRPLA